MTDLHLSKKKIDIFVDLTNSGTHLYPKSTKLMTEIKETGVQLKPVRGAFSDLRMYFGFFYDLKYTQ